MRASKWIFTGTVVSSWLVHIRYKCTYGDVCQGSGDMEYINL